MRDEWERERDKFEESSGPTTSGTFPGVGQRLGGEPAEIQQPPKISDAMRQKQFDLQL